MSEFNFAQKKTVIFGPYTKSTLGKMLHCHAQKENVNMHAHVTRVT